nr:hypothetical protein [Tanacetum cinerariifolium]
MATLVIFVSLDLSVENVGSFFRLVILIGSIYVEARVAPEVGADAVASPVGVLEPDTHSSSEVAPSESSLPPVSVAPMVLPFLCSDDSKSDTEMPERHVSPTPHDDMLTRDLTARKLVGPYPSHRLALRYTSHHLDHFTSGTSSDQLSSDHSSYRHYISGLSLSGHTLPDTTIADSSIPPRFVHPPLARTLPRDSSSESSAGPSRKRCRSFVATVTSFIHALRALVPFYADLLLPRKRFRDFISPEDTVEEDTDTNVLANIEADATAIEVAIDRDVEAGVDACIGMEVDVGVNVEEAVEDEVESSDMGTMKVGVDVVDGIDYRDGMLMPDAMERLEQRELEARSLIADEERASLLEQIMTIIRSGMTPVEIKELINQRVAKVLAAYEANHAAEHVVKSQSQNRDDDDNENVRGSGNINGGGNGDEDGGGNGNRNR